MRPPKEDLVSYNGNRTAIARDYNISTRTAVRWMKYYGLLMARNNYGPNKLNMKKARKIRELHESGVSMKDLAKKYEVTISSIHRIIRNQTYKEIKETAEIYVVYNPLKRHREE